jgi:hypothetical protein
VKNAAVAAADATVNNGVRRMSPPRLGMSLARGGSRWQEPL